MTSTIASGAKIAATAVALVLSGAVTASAEDKPRTAEKPPTEKMACGGKNGCGAEAMGKGMDKATDTRGAESDSKAAAGESMSGGRK